METIEEWLKKKVFECNLGRVSPAQCRANRERPRFDDGGRGPFMPAVCEKCTDWREKMQEIIKIKKCSKCGKQKPLEEFHKDNKAKDGHASWCKQCVKDRRRRKPANVREELRCSKCDRSLEWVNDERRFIVGHYSTPDGLFCVECYNGNDLVVHK